MSSNVRTALKDECITCNKRNKSRINKIQLSKVENSISAMPTYHAKIN